MLSLIVHKNVIDWFWSFHVRMLCELYLPIFRISYWILEISKLWTLFFQMIHRNLIYRVLRTFTDFLLNTFGKFCTPCRKISWRSQSPNQTVWFPVLVLTVRPGLGLARTVTFLYDQPLVSGWPHEKNSIAEKTIQNLSPAKYLSWPYDIGIVLDL